MNKADTATTDLMDRSAISTRQKISMFISEIKALIKIGIVNSNLITTFAGLLLALHFTGSSLANNWATIILTMAGSAFVIAGGCIINNWYDVDIDPQMDRTKKRPTVTGYFKMNTVLKVGVGTSAAGLILLLFTTVEAALFAFIGWFVYVVLYTMWSKRRYTLNTAIGSLSGAMPPLIGWAAISPGWHVVPVAMFLIMFIWQTPHFLALAMKKTDDYRAAGVPMLPVVYGFEFTKRQIVVYISCLLPVPFLLTPYLGVAFTAIATVLNLGWLLIGFKGFFGKNDLKWANMIFFYSLSYLVILFPLMVIVTLPVFN